MTDPLIDLWTDSEEEPMTETLDLTAIAARADQLDRQLTRRNLVEVVMGLAVSLFFGVVGAVALASGAVGFGVGGLLLSLGGAAIAVQIRRLGRAPEADHAAPTRDFLAAHRAELRHQIDLLQAVPRWYLGPLVPGMVVFAAGAPLERFAAGGSSLAETAVTAGASLALVGVVLGVVVRLNRRAARTLQEELDALDAGGGATAPE